MNTVRKLEIMNERLIEQEDSIYGGDEATVNIQMNETNTDGCPYCSPKYGGRKICYSKDVLGKMISEWNNAHPNDEIPYERSMKKMELWKKLKERLNGEQWCWLGYKEFENIEDIENFFKPLQPFKDGLNTWLSTRDINNVMHQYEKIHPDFIFLGAVPIDFKELYNPVSSFDVCNRNIQNGKIKKIGMVFNTDPHTKSGQHWIAMFINVSEKYIKFFDSTGNSPPNEVEQLIEKIQNQLEECDLNGSFTK